MAVSFVQTKSAGTTAGTTLACAFTTNPTAGNGLIVFIGCVSATATVTAISDTATNTFVAFSNSAGAGMATFCYYVKANKTTAADSVSVTLSATGGFMELEIYEVNPGAAQLLADQQVPGSSTSSSSISIGPTGTLANASEFCATYAILAGSVGANGSGWTANNTLDGNFGQYKIVTTTAAVTGTGTSSGTVGYAGIVATFRGGTSTLSFPFTVVDTSAVAIGFHNTRRFPFTVTDTSTAAISFHNTRRFTLLSSDSSAVSIGFRNTRRFPLTVLDTSAVSIGFHIGQRFALAVIDTSAVNIGFHIGQHFQLAIADSSSVTIGYHIGQHFPLVIADTSLVSIGYHILGAPLHFPIQIADTSAVAIGFHAGAPLHFPIQIADLSSVSLSWSFLTYRFPLTANDHSLVNLSFQIFQIFAPPLNPMAPYTGQEQPEDILVPAWIRYREEEWEDGPWAMPPYAWIFPQPVPLIIEERGTDSFHHEWLKTHPRPPGPRRMGDHNHRPQSVLPPFVRSKPIALKTYVNRPTLLRPNPAARNRLHGKSS